mgnify:CR=1 FL=1
MKIAGITRIRNEEAIIKDTLDHVASLVDEIYVYDDCSTDKTVEICKKHPKVVKVIEGKEWKGGSFERNKAEGDLRQKIYEEALKGKPDWIYYFDADEIASFEDIDFKADAYKLRLFDFYITEEDKNKHWLERKMMGCEYRDILMLFKVMPGIEFHQREPWLPECNIQQAGYVKHYGKAISIEEWEKTCDYYINERGDDNKFKMFREKWKARKGKAIHTMSDFRTPLIQWHERKTKGVLLTE